jgi:hypothetical protein
MANRLASGLFMEHDKTQARQPKHRGKKRHFIKKTFSCHGFETSGA